MTRSLAWEPRSLFKWSHEGNVTRSRGSKAGLLPPTEDGGEALEARAPAGEESRELGKCFLPDMACSNKVKGMGASLGVVSSQDDSDWAMLRDGGGSFDDDGDGDGRRLFFLRAATGLVTWEEIQHRLYAYAVNAPLFRHKY